MRFIIETQWKGETTLIGTCTAVIAYDAIGNGIENFAGDTRRQGKEKRPTLESIVDMKPTGKLVFECGDESGHFRAVVRCIK